MMKVQETGYYLYRRRNTYHIASSSDQESFLIQLEESFGYEGLAEFTIEAGRPDSITREKLQAIQEYPVTRISVNPQTMNQKTLDIIGRQTYGCTDKRSFLSGKGAGI